MGSFSGFLDSAAWVCWPRPKVNGPKIGNNSPWGNKNLPFACQKSPPEMTSYSHIVDSSWKTISFSTEHKATWVTCLKQGEAWGYPWSFGLASEGCHVGVHDRFPSVLALNDGWIAAQWAQNKCIALETWRLLLRKMGCFVLLSFFFSTCLNLFSFCLHFTFDICNLHWQTHLKCNQD